MSCVQMDSKLASGEGRRNVAFALTFAALVAAACGGGSDGTGGNDRQSVSSEPSTDAPNGTRSTNWSGYSVRGEPGGINAVSGRWTVPAVSSSGGDTASSTWTGIGGNCFDSSCATPDGTLVQAGTEQDVIDGERVYYAWWEVLPAPAVPAGGLLDPTTYDVEPGDEITVTIDGSSLVVWQIEITNVRNDSRHWQFTTTVPYVSSGLSADWIVEAPLGVPEGQIALSDFRRVDFSDLTANGETPELSEGQAIVLVSSDGDIIARPSFPDPSGDGFAVCFGAEPCR
jgi:hypothetical protein